MSRVRASSLAGARAVAALATSGRGSSSAAPTKPHVCFVSMSMYSMLVDSTGIDFAGGGEMQQAVLARMLRADGFRVSVLTGDHGQADVVESGGVSIHRVNAPANRGVKGLRFLHPLSTDIVTGLRRIDPDVVYFRVAGFRAAAVAWYARIHGKRFLYACASDREFQDRHVSKLPWRDEFLFRLALRSADGVLVQNVQQQRLLAENFGKPSQILPNCFEEPGVARSASGGPVLWVGTFKPVKRPERFLELARRRPSVHHVMVGGADHANDPGHAYFNGMRDAAKAIPNLEFVGFVPLAEVGSYFDEASALVNTSDSEGFPNTFLQAWIRGIPTLSFVAPEVAPGETGTIVCRDLDDLVGRLDRLFSEPHAWQQASDACLAHFKRVHSVDAVLQQYRCLLQYPIGESAVGRRP